MLTFLSLPRPLLQVLRVALGGSAAAVYQPKHVLVEKPMCTTVEDTLEVRWGGDSLTCEEKQCRECTYSRPRVPN